MEDFMKRFICGLASFLLLACFGTELFAFGSTELPESSFSGEYVLSADKVKNANAILVDARGKKADTIKGAVVVSWQELATCADGKPGDANWGVILDKTRLDKKLGDLGLDMDKPIVVFGDTGKAWGEEGRIVWQLLAVGYKNVKFVDGGYNAMLVAGFEKSNTGTKLPAVKVDTKPVDTDFSIDTETLRNNYATYKVVDTRNDDEYKGAQKYGEAKGGKLPGAVLVKFTDLFQANGLLKSNAEIENLFQASGLKKSDVIVTYCTGGIRSAYMQLVMKMLGYEAKNYDESFYRWCNVYEVE